MLQPSRILEICGDHDFASCDVGDSIKPKKLANARARLPIPPAETVFALVDFTVFGSNKDGLAVGKHGVYWKCPWPHGPGSLTWAQLAEARLLVHDGTIRVTEALKLEGLLADTALPLHGLLEALRVAAGGAPGGSVPVVEDEPVVRVDPHAWTPFGAAGARDRLEEQLWDLRNALGISREAAFHVGSIPSQSLETARERLSMPADERVFAFLDFTQNETAKTGIAVGASGIFWHSGFLKAAGYASWPELMELATPLVDGSRIEMPNGRHVNTVGAAFAHTQIGAFLTALRDWAVAERRGGAAPTGASAALHVLAGAMAVQVQRMETERGRGGLRRAYTGEALPELVAEVRRAAGLPADERVIAFVDLSRRGTGDAGVVLAASGLCWWNNAATAPGRLAWSEFARTRISSDRARIELGGHGSIGMEVDEDERTSVLELLRNAQHWALHNAATEPAKQPASASPAPPPAPAPPAATTFRRWMLARDGQQSGPFDGAALAELLRSGATDPDATFAWTEGMPQWLPFREVPELAAMIAPPAMAPPPPPPPLAAPPAASAPVDGAVDVNTAELEDLLVLPGVTRDGAERIVAERASRGGLGSVEEVAEILGLKPHQVEELREEVVFGRRPARAGRVIDY